MSKTDCGGTYLKDKVDVLPVMLGKKGITDTGAVLMTGHTAKRIASAVEEEALFGVNGEGTAAEACCHSVLFLTVCNKHCLCGVKIGICNTVPEVNGVEFEFSLGILTVFCLLCYYFAFGIKNRKSYFTLTEGFNLDFPFSVLFLFIWAGT